MTISLLEHPLGAQPGQPGDRSAFHFETITRLPSTASGLGRDGARYGRTGEMIERYKELTPYLRIHTRTGLNFFTAVSQEMVGLLNQYVQGAIDTEHFINRYATMAWMMMLESALN